MTLIKIEAHSDKFQIVQVATCCLLLIVADELTEHRTKCTVQQPFTVPTDSVQWTLCAVGATD